jgi:predicted GNAT family N-acyltransferase
MTVYDRVKYIYKLFKLFMSNPSIRLAKLPSEIEAVKFIRKTVFQKEQGVSPELDFDGLDEICDLFVAVLNNEFVGTVRVRLLDSNKAKIERLAVLQQVRGYGIAKLLVAIALDAVESKNIPEVVVHSQEYIKGLYENLGFTQVGDIFDEAGIAHVKMKKIFKT